MRLPPVNPVSLYVSSNSGKSESYVADELWLIELTEVARQKEDASFIDLFYQIQVGHTDKGFEMMIKSRFIDSDYSNKFYVFLQEMPQFRYTMIVSQIS